MEQPWAKAWTLDAFFAWQERQDDRYEDVEAAHAQEQPGKPAHVHRPRPEGLARYGGVTAMAHDQTRDPQCDQHRPEQ